MKAPHILNDASNLLGAALLIVTALHVTRYAPDSHADELAFAAAVLFLVSCGLSYQSLRRDHAHFETLADRVFLVAQALLMLSVLSFWF